MRHGFGGFGLRRQCQRLYRQSPYFFINKKGKARCCRSCGNNGFVTVIKDLGLKEPYIGKTPIVSGEIAEDITSYYADQRTNTHGLRAPVFSPFMSNGEIICAGGFMIQLLPTANDTIIERVEGIKDLPPVTKCFPTV